MPILKNLRFFSPDGDAGGGGAAVAEMKASGADVGPALENPGVLYQRSIQEQQGKAPAPVEPPPKADPPPPAEKKDAAPPEKKDEPKPASALDAVLDAPEPEGKADDAPATGAEDYLKDIPEKLPKDKQGENWTKARSAIERLGTVVSERDKRITELTAQIETSTTPSAELVSENERLKAENAEQKEALIGLNIEFEPNYRAKFIDGRKAMVDKAAAKLNAFGGKGELIAEALVMPEGRGRTQAIKEALQDLEPVEQNRVLQFVSEVEKLDDERDSMKKVDQAEAWEKLKATDVKKQQIAKEEGENYKKKVYDDTLKGIANKILLLRSVDATIPGAEEHNKAAQQITEEAWRLLGTGVTPQELSERAFWAAAGPQLQTHLVVARKEVRELNKRLAEYETADPGFRGGKPPVKSKTEEDLEKTPGQLFADKMRDLRGGADG